MQKIVSADVISILNEVSEKGETIWYANIL